MGHLLQWLQMVMVRLFYDFNPEAMGNCLPVWELRYVIVDYVSSKPGHVIAVRMTSNHFISFPGSAP